MVTIYLADVEQTVAYYVTNVEDATDKKPLVFPEFNTLDALRAKIDELTEADDAREWNDNGPNLCWCSIIKEDGTCTFVERDMEVDDASDLVCEARMMEVTENYRDEED